MKSQDIEQVAVKLCLKDGYLLPYSIENYLDLNESDLKKFVRENWADLGRHPTRREVKCFLFALFSVPLHGHDTPKDKKAAKAARDAKTRPAVLGFMFNFQKGVASQNPFKGKQKEEFAAGYVVGGVTFTRYLAPPQGSWEEFKLGMLEIDT